MSCDTIHTNFRAIKCHDRWRAPPQRGHGGLHVSRDTFHTIFRFYWSESNAVICGEQLRDVDVEAYM